MPIIPRTAPGVKMVRFDLDPRSATEVWFALACSLHADETTTGMRTTVAGLLPQFARAIAATGFVEYATLLQFQKHLTEKPAPPALDVALGLSKHR